MWKLCIGEAKSETGSSYSRDSEVFGTDFSHQGWNGKWAGTGELKEFSTFPQDLLLLLVL
jgi:hypothetical protein